MQPQHIVTARLIEKPPLCHRSHILYLITAHHLRHVIFVNYTRTQRIGFFFEAALRNYSGISPPTEKKTGTNRNRITWLLARAGVYSR